MCPTPNPSWDYACSNCKIVKIAYVLKQHSYIIAFGLLFKETIGYAAIRNLKNSLMPHISVKCFSKIRKSELHDAILVNEDLEFELIFN